MRRKPKIICIALLLVLCSAGTGFALTLPGLDISGGVMWLGNAETEGGPSPLLGVWGVGLPLKFTPLFSIDPALSMFGTQYQLTTDGSKAVPTEIEYASSLWALALMLDVPFRFTFHVSDTISLGAGPHLAFLFRIPTIGWGDASARTGDPDHRAAIVAYWYENARFLYPGAGLFFNWKMFENIGFYVRLLSLFPLFHAWDGENARFWDQLHISGRVGVRFYFKPASTGE
jgi:hypothetical protein